MAAQKKARKSVSKKVKKPVKKAVTIRARAKPLKKPAKRKLVKRTPVRKKLVKRKTVRKSPVKKRAVKRFVSKPLPVARRSFPEGRLAGIVEAAVKRARSEEVKSARVLKGTVSRKTVSDSVSMFGDEELALRMLDVYFSEVARHGLKRKLTLDEVVKAYFYALMRVQRKDIELSAIKEMVGRRN